MKFALISYEYPPDTGIGGIGTYFYQLALLLTNRGHYVEVFSASFHLSSSGDEGNGFLVHRIHCPDKHLFKEAIVPIFNARQSKIFFEISESPEYMADGLGIKTKFPNLPMVVKLHTPDFFVKELNNLNTAIPSSWMRLRFIFGSYRRFKKPRPYWWIYDYKNDPEYQLIQLAELITTPSRSLGSIVAKKWKIPFGKIALIPNPFSASEELLNIPIETNTNIISYIGRMEVRKGVAIFAEVVPAVLKELPNVRFRFIGRDIMSSPVAGVTMKDFLKTKLGDYEKQIEFIDHCSPAVLTGYLAETAVCVFPSIWENFPNVCLEAMSAGRAIIASKHGGMKDMLSNPTAGVIVDPVSVKAIVNAIIKVYRNRQLRYLLGSKARNVVQRKYGADMIGELIERRYSAIARK